MYFTSKTKQNKNPAAHIFLKRDTLNAFSIKLGTRQGYYSQYHYPKYIENSEPYMEKREINVS